MIAPWNRRSSEDSIPTQGRWHTPADETNDALWIADDGDNGDNGVARLVRLATPILSSLGQSWNRLFEP